MDAVEVDLHIDAEPQDVWDYAMDPAGTTEWVTIVRRVEHADDGPLEVGYRMDQRLCLRGVPFTVRWRLVEVDAPRFARWEGRGQSSRTAWSPSAAARASPTRTSSTRPSGRWARSPPAR